MLVGDIEFNFVVDTETASPVMSSKEECMFFFLWQDPFGEKRGMFDFVSIKQRLEVIKKRLEEKKPVGQGSDASSSENENLEES